MVGMARCAVPARRLRAENQELEQLRNETRELHKLRNEIRQLREQKPAWDTLRADEVKLGIQFFAEQDAAPVEVVLPFKRVDGGWKVNMALSP